MKRTILTLIAAGLLVPLAAATAKAGPKHERRGVSVDAGPGGIEIAYRSTKHEGDRRGQRAGYGDGGDHRGYRGRPGPVGRHGPHGRRDVRHREIDVRLRLAGIRRGEHRRWVPGHWTVEERRVRLPDRYERVWVPDRYEMRRDACGRRYRVLVEEGHHEQRLIPGRFIVKHERVWVPGHWDRC